MFLMMYFNTSLRIAIGGKEIIYNAKYMDPNGVAKAYMELTDSSFKKRYTPQLVSLKERNKLHP